MAARQKLIVREVTFEEENGAKGNRKRENGGFESRKMEVRGRRRVGATEQRAREGRQGRKGSGCRARRVTRERGSGKERGERERVKAALQYPTLGNRSAIHWSIRVISRSFGE